MLQELIHNARRRLLFNEVLKQFALSAALAIGGLALLLTLGTRYVEWWVVAIFAVAVTVWAAAKLRKRLPNDYAAAVWLDDKAGLHDSLSTAHYFAVSKSRTLTPEAEAILLAQRGLAETAASDVDVSITVPFRFPKALYGLAALLLVSSGLVTVRYFYGHELNLTAPITEVIFQDLAAVKSPKAAKPDRAPKKQDEYDEARSLLSKLGLGANLEEKPDEKLDEALADALKSPEKTLGTGDQAKLDQKMDKGDPLDTPKDSQKNNDSNQAGNNSDKKPGDSGDSPNSQGGGKSSEKGDKSLLSKLKDAMDNMMGAPSPSSDKKSGGKPQQSKSSSQAQAGQQPGEAGDEENKTPADGEASGNAQKSNSPGQTSGNTSDKQEGPSAAGSEDGEKAIKAAAQMKAMGKISELIGKRSEQVTGESMIEVQSGNQKLQTAYKDSAATHGEGTGEVSRDQIPLSVQAYVQEYFQQVRKPEGTAKATATKKSPAPVKP